MPRSFSAALLVISLCLLSACTHLHPTLGQLPEGDRLSAVQASPHYQRGAFQNEVATPPRASGMAFLWGMLKNRFKPRERPTPPAALPAVKTDLAALPREQDLVVWLGHSSFFVQLGGQRLQIDPVFSDHAAPFSWMVKAYAGTTLYRMDELPAVDAVLISHDHYDHLDHATMLALKNKTPLVITGLGNGAHLAHWGYPPEHIREQDWHSTVVLNNGLRVHVLPSQHFSGRYMDRNQSLWVSFVLENAQRRLYFSGDTGFGPQFEQIAKRFAGFDLISLDSGQYNPQWADMHMTPEEASRAAEILRTRVLLPGHAGRFTLARHAWDEPFERALAASENKSYRLLTPRIGDVVALDGRTQSFPAWWRDVK